MEKTFAENFSFLRTLAARADALRSAEWTLLTRELDAARETPGKLAELYCRLCGQKNSPAALCVPEFAALCVAVAPSMPQHPWSGMEEAEPAAQRTAYLQNTYTDRAYRVFAARRAGMQAEYHSGYTAVCEEVYYDRCQYCILPVYTSTDGMSVSFRRMLGKYDLKICAETDVEMSDESVMRFALLQKKLRLPQADYLETTVVLPEGVTPGMFFSACEAIGFGVRSVYSWPTVYDAEELEYCLQLAVDPEKENTAALALFWDALPVRYTVEGAYRME